MRRAEKPRGIYHQTFVLAPIGRTVFVVRDFIRFGVPGGIGLRKRDMAPLGLTSAITLNAA
jgi:hypothetical protein